MGEKRVLVPSDLSEITIITQKKPRLTDKPLTLKQICTIGMLIKDRYAVQKVIGEGTFGKVLKVTDTKTNKLHAMKIIKNTCKFGLTGFFSEHDVLEKIKTMDPTNISRLIILESTYVIGRHLVLLFELYPISLLHYIKKTENGADFMDIKIVAYQVLQALRFLSKLCLSHGDLKLENIMIVDESTLQIKVIDLGCAFKVNTQPYQYFQTRYYRAPEVTLRAYYDNAVDIWSLACIMFEMRTKSPLFECKNEARMVELLRRMIEVLGLPPKCLLREGSRTDTFFEGGKRSHFIDKSNLTPKSRSIYKMLCTHQTGEYVPWRYCSGDLRSFVELLGKMLNYDRKYRMKVDEAMKHRFFKSVANELENGGVYCKTT
ncbi:unnamed protein product [Orchesella dallaii]|uniref:Protein kinase domain-containing protein n=1 Tax=Orchesella dallaii TaxID=48710 RepID=A0ABP1RCU2_9HEXA